MGLDKPGKPPYNEAVKDVEGKKDGNSRPQRAGGCCKPAGRRMTSASVAPDESRGEMPLTASSKSGTALQSAVQFGWQHGNFLSSHGFGRKVFLYSATFRRRFKIARRM